MATAAPADIISLILHGCKLAREVESSLANLQPEALGNSLNDIIGVFEAARDRLNAGKEYHFSSYPSGPMFHQQSEGLKEWLIRRSTTIPCTSSAMEMYHRTPTFEVGGDPLHERVKEIIGTKQMPLRAAVCDVQAMDTGGASKAAASSSSQRLKRRKDAGDKRTMRVPVPTGGNTEIPPDDGFGWRKYGQKEILGSKFPRAYFRCTHQKLYQCPAKKQVQRLDDDPLTYEVTYRGEHTCYMSATAPIISSVPQATLVSAPEVSLGGSSSSGSGMVVTTAVGVGSSSRHEFQYPVADMAYALFNSGSTNTSDSMELIFTHQRQRGDTLDQ
ncbi:hypothetical protein K2173_023342 [Erythroxylum novogranatense]|uniref:WRKY domain-containing protein n=1 Tax=Erythroxylum novogranatense TaxID=1862640 RepID=A0AAV8TVU0_9ROSI|nr:hypothetical protein K2173_023342 [Erythroxylum novogranatense]